jgi:hypothetical protein
MVYHTIFFLGESPPETDLASASIRAAAPRPGMLAEASLSRQWPALLARPWFIRVWIYQEPIFSNGPWVQCSVMRGEMAPAMYGE